MIIETNKLDNKREFENLKQGAVELKKILSAIIENWNLFEIYILKFMIF